LVVSVSFTLDGALPAIALPPQEEVWPRHKTRSAGSTTQRFQPMGIGCAEIDI
jgi:hypothetical protein